MQIANLRFLLSSDEIISRLKQDNIAFFKEDFIYYAGFKNNKIITQKSSKNAISNPLYGAKYYFCLNKINYIFELYYFCDTMILEVNFNNTQQKNNYEMPEFLAKNIEQNITNNQNFSPSNLALFAKPFSSLDFDKILNRAKLLGDFSLFLPCKICAFDGVRITLFALLEKTNKAISSFLNKKNNKHLNKLLALLQKNLILLNALKDLFDEQSVQIFVLKLQSIEKELSTLVKNLEFSNTKLCEQSVLKLQNLLNDWALFLSDNSHSYSSKLGLNELKMTLSSILIKACKDFIKDKQKIKILEFLLFSFGGLYQYKLARKTTKKLQKKQKKLQKSVIKFAKILEFYKG